MLVVFSFEVINPSRMIKNELSVRSLWSCFALKKTTDLSWLKQDGVVLETCGNCICFPARLMPHCGQAGACLNWHVFCVSMKVIICSSYFSSRCNMVPQHFLEIFWAKMDCGLGWLSWNTRAGMRTHETCVWCWVQSATQSQPQLVKTCVHF